MNIGTCLREHFGPDLCLTAPDNLAQWVDDPWGMQPGNAAAVLLPRSVMDVSEMVRFCVQNKIELVPQGGMTGLVGGGVPDESGQQVVLNLARLDRIREIDANNFTITVEAGCILAQVQEAAEQHDRLFPPSFGAEGSCQIGGVLSTNAGGHNVLRYGNTRELVLGLEVVLADGTIWNGLRKLRKDNTGYDLKQLFIGAEGTLGVITAAVFKLFPKITATRTLIAALQDLEAVPQLLAYVRQASADALSAFEIFSQRLVDLHTEHFGPVHCVPAHSGAWYVLMEFSTAGTQDSLDGNVQSLLENAFESGLITDATIGNSLAQQDEMWHLRDSTAEAQLKNGLVFYADVAVAVSEIPAFIQKATSALKELDPEVDINAFGHAGDGNIHFNLLQPTDIDAEAFRKQLPLYEKIIFETVTKFNGSFSAEHGVGSVKLAQMTKAKPAIEIKLMRQIRSSISNAYLNPRKLIP